MNVTFFLRDLTKEKGSLTSGNEQPIWAYFTFNGRRLRISTQIKVYLKDWNEKKQQIRGTSSDVAKQNHRLRSISGEAESIAQEYTLKKLILTEQILKAKLIPVIFPDRVKVNRKIDLYEFLTDFINENPKNIKVGSMKSYKQLQPLLLEFSKLHSKSMLEFDLINSSWGELFIKFLKEKKNHSINNCDKHIKNVKALMSYSLQKELHTNFKFEYIGREKEETKEIYLNREEIKAIYKLEVDESYQVTKDLFVLSCLTGLRISDILGLKKHNWKNDFFSIETKKTEDKLEIPLEPTAKAIAQKYNGEFPHVYESRYNKQLKDISEQIPSLQTEEVVYSTKGGIRTQGTAYKFELVKSHTGRRSFATNEYLAGTDLLLIRAVTGHRTEKDFFKYIKLDQREKATSLLEKFKKRKAF